MKAERNGKTENVMARTRLPFRQAGRVVGGLAGFVGDASV